MFNLRKLIREEIEKLSFEKLKQFHGNSFEYNIKKNGEKIGTISVELKKDMLGISTIVIDDKFRSQGFGTNSLKQIVLNLKKK